MQVHKTQKIYRVENSSSEVQRKRNGIDRKEQKKERKQRENGEKNEKEKVQREK